MLNHGLGSEDWKVAYSGIINNIGVGVSFDKQGVTLSTKPSSVSTETHACLVTSNHFEKSPVQNFDLALDAMNVEQLRTGSAPNAWECFWLLTNYTIDKTTGKKTCNYIAFKPTGIELGIAYGEVGQKFLKTIDSVKFTMGQIFTAHVEKIGKQLYVGINGQALINDTFPDLIDQPGTFGLYTEDAKALVKSLVLSVL